MFLFHRNKKGMGSGEQWGRGKGGSVQGLCLTAHISAFIRCSPCSPVPCLVLSLGCQRCWAVATPINTAGTHHLQFLYTITVYSSPGIFFRKSREGEGKKNWEKDFCFLASLELSTERCHHTTKLANKPQTKQKALFSQEQGAPQNQMPPKYPNDSKSIVD